MTLSSSIDQNRYIKTLPSLERGEDPMDVSSELVHETDVATVLLLEDEPLIAIDLEYSLVAEGYAVKICSSCEEALAWLETRDPSLALLDIQLKDGPSTAVARRLKALNVPFIVCSGRDRAEASEIFSDCHWLNKPCAAETVLHNVQTALSRHTDKAFYK